MPNSNTPEDLEKLTNRLLANLSLLEHAPGVQFAYAPPDFFQREVDDDDLAQQEVHLEGGGLAAGSRPLQEVKNVIRRADDRMGTVDHEDDRDQRESMDVLRIGAEVRPRAD